MKGKNVMANNLKVIRGQSDSSFVKYIEYVQEKLCDDNHTFFVDCQDSGERIINDMWVCDLFGWIIPNDLIDKFYTIWLYDEVSDDWIDYFVSVTWKLEDGVIKLKADNNYIIPKDLDAL